ncbi:hypothetical protein C0J52_10080 [Blattella germanica]|nr:hypothetical protein C0J52_10080 [Blattella germanica]
MLTVSPFETFFCSSGRPISSKEGEGGVVLLSSVLSLFSNTVVCYYFCFLQVPAHLLSVCWKLFVLCVQEGGSHFPLSYMVLLAESICFVLTPSTLGHRAYSE